MKRLIPFPFLPGAFQAALLIAAVFEFREDVADQSEEAETMTGPRPASFVEFNGLMNQCSGRASCVLNGSRYDKFE
eukprot:scaffold10742_cov43-Skeletonema_menzelii.AAC.1